MDKRRWLVPFTWGLDMQALDAVISLAEGGRAALVAVSLISRPDRPGSRGPRLEAIQQSKDFLEAIWLKAEKAGVPIERHEVITVNVLQSICLLTSELHCGAVVLVSRGEHEALLHSSQLKHILADPPAALLVLRLASSLADRRLLVSFPSMPFLLRLWNRIWHRENKFADQVEKDSFQQEEPLWIRTEDYHRGMSL
ncbi:MAG TPA: hypothetical protein VKT25_15295 [Ktedonobacteraceae bacterium]|nr:hypothetical protein [Ktedonobacteraceae bacterium]